MQVKSAVAPTATTFDITTSWYASPEPDIFASCYRRRLSGNWPLGQQYSLRVISGYFVVQSPSRLRWNFALTDINASSCIRAVHNFG